jgi:hypothetical protein
MGQFRVGDLDGDSVPEMVSIYLGTYLVILDNEGNLKSAKVLPTIPTVSTQDMGHMPGMPWNPWNPGDPEHPENPTIPNLPGLFAGASMGMRCVEIADLDGDDVPEIVTNYFGTHLVILDNEGDLKDYKVLPTLTDILAAE